MCFCFRLRISMQNPSRAAKSFGDFKILSRLQNALACAKSWVTALRLQNALLASHYLAAARNMLWTHEKCSTQKSRILVSGLENEGTFQAVSNFFVGCEIQQGLQNPSRASKSFEGCKILWSLQNPESAAKSFRGFKILSRLQNPLACPKSSVTVFKLRNTLLASHYLAAASSLEDVMSTRKVFNKKSCISFPAW